MYKPTIEVLVLEYVYITILEEEFDGFQGTVRCMLFTFLNRCMFNINRAKESAMLQLDPSNPLFLYHPIYALVRIEQKEHSFSDIFPKI